MRLSIDSASKPGVRKPNEVILYVGVACVACVAEKDEEKSRAIERDTQDDGWCYPEACAITLLGLNNLHYEWFCSV